MTPLFIPLVLALFLLPQVVRAEETPYGKQKVVYHINDSDTKRHKVALRNLENHIKALGEDNAEIRVVMHGAGLSLLKEAKKDVAMRQKISQLKMQNVGFYVCANTLESEKIDYKTALFDVDKKDIVPSGVAEIARLQQQGYVYIKP